MTIPRAAIKNAAYNPRRISDAARKRLKEKIKSVGLVNAPVWNERTGNLVSGHQRLGIIDALERSQNYLVTVDAIDVDEKTEQEMNVFLNNTSAMGEWDEEALRGVMTAWDDIKPEDFGFDAVEFDYLLGNGVFDKDHDKNIEPEVSKLGEIKEARKKIKEGNVKVDDAGFYAVVVFQDREKLERWVSSMGYPPDERYLDGKIIEAAAQLRTGLNGQ